MIWLIKLLRIILLETTRNDLLNEQQVSFCYANLEILDKLLAF